MDPRFDMVGKTVIVTALLALPTVLAGCGSLEAGATIASDPPPAMPDLSVASSEPAVPPTRPPFRKSYTDPEFASQEPAQIIPASLSPKQSVVRRSTERLADAKDHAIPRSVEHVNDRSFKQLVLDSEEAVLVDFYADWCGPCKKLSPVLDALAQETPSTRIVKVNIDRSPEAAASYRVKSIPTLILFKNGKPVARRGGFVSKDSLKELISQP
jgi:thioredoxin 1